MPKKEGDAPAQQFHYEGVDIISLPLVLAEILDNEWPDIGDGQQALPSGVNCETTKVADNPSASQLLSDRCRRSGATEEIDYQVTRLR